MLLRIAAAVGQDMGDDDGSEIGADRLIAVMDSIGVEKAQVLSVAYFYGFPDSDMEEREAGTRDRKSTRLNSSHVRTSRMPPSA